MCFFPAACCLNSLPLAVSERDALLRHFKVDGGGVGQRAAGQRLADGLGHSLRPRQRLHVYRVDVEDVARCTTVAGKSKTFSLKGQRASSMTTRAKQNGAGCVFLFTVSVLRNLLDCRRKKTEQVS